MIIWDRAAAEDEDSRRLARSLSARSRRRGGEATKGHAPMTLSTSSTAVTLTVVLANIVCDSSCGRLPAGRLSFFQRGRRLERRAPAA